MLEKKNPTTEIVDTTASDENQGRKIDCSHATDQKKDKEEAPPINVKENFFFKPHLSTTPEPWHPSHGF